MLNIFEKIAIGTCKKSEQPDYVGRKVHSLRVSAKITIDMNMNRYLHTYKHRINEYIERKTI